jgi:hypothetical protein
MSRGEYQYPKAGPPVERRSFSGRVDPSVVLLELGDVTAGVRYVAYGWGDLITTGKSSSGSVGSYRSRDLWTTLEAWSPGGRWTVSNLLVLLDELGVIADNVERWSAGYSDIDGLCLPPTADPEFCLRLLGLSETDGALIALEPVWWRPDLVDHYQTTGDPQQLEFRASLSQMWDGARSCRAAIVAIDAIPSESGTEDR